MSTTATYQIPPEREDWTFERYKAECLALASGAAESAPDSPDPDKMIELAFLALEWMARSGDPAFAPDLSTAYAMNTIALSMETLLVATIRDGERGMAVAERLGNLYNGTPMTRLIKIASLAAIVRIEERQS